MPTYPDIRAIFSVDGIFATDDPVILKYLHRMAKHNEFGEEGEEIAARFLVGKGYRIQEKNYRYRRAEIDIIAQKDNVLAIVEVRARSTDHLIPIAETIHSRKMQLLIKAANHYVTSRHLDVEVRFDIIAILKNNRIFKIEHLESAFYHF